ncbi:MAG TPA: hypothetical protein VGE12_15250, partial [Noviherbaspirillum sp.]
MPPGKPKGRPSCEEAASQNVELAKDQHRHPKHKPAAPTAQEPHSRTTSKKVRPSSTDDAPDHDDLLLQCGIDPDTRKVERRNPSPVIIARGRLADAKKVFTHRGWDVLPQGHRGHVILRWAADHAFLASPDNPMRSVRNWCRRWAPWLTGAELDALLEGVKHSNKRWSPDQCAVTLEITVSDRNTLGLRFIGAEDDPDYLIRNAARRAKNAAANRRYRAAHSTGRKRGRPALQMSPEERQAHDRKLAAERKRRSRKSANVTLKCVMPPISIRTHHGIKRDTPLVSPSPALLE